MPIFLIFLGVILVTVGVRGTQTEFFSLFKNDVSGFLPWVAVLAIFGYAGNIQGMRGISNAFLVLFIAAFALKNGRAIVSGFQSGGATSVPQFSLEGFK